MKPNQTTAAATAALLVFCCVMAFPPVTHADGFLDKLNSALKKLQPPSAQHPGNETSQTAGTAAAAQPVSSPAPASAATLPVPSDSGTAEGTAAILKAVPDLSAGDFRIGMPADEAIAKLKSKEMLADRHSSDIGVWSFRIRQVPDHDFVGGASGLAGSEGVRMNFTTYPNPAVVSALQRYLTFPKDKAPTVSTTLAALRKKYGPETMSVLHMNTLNWLYDYQGHPISQAQLERIKKAGCVQTTAQFLIESIGNESTSAKRVTEGIANIARPECLALVSIRANLDTTGVAVGDPDRADKGWDSIADVLVTGLNVTIFDMPLEFSASEVSRDVALHNGEIQKQKEINAARKREAPSL